MTLEYDPECAGKTYPLFRHLTVIHDDSISLLIILRSSDGEVVPFGVGVGDYGGPGVLLLEGVRVVDVQSLQPVGCVHCGTVCGCVKVIGGDHSLQELNGDGLDHLLGLLLRVGGLHVVLIHVSLSVHSQAIIIDIETLGGPGNYPRDTGLTQNVKVYWGVLQVNCSVGLQLCGILHGHNETLPDVHEGISQG